VDALLTSRLAAVALTHDHLADITALLGDPRVGETLGGAQSPAASRAILARHVEHWRVHGFGLWAFTDRATGAFVGRGGPQHTYLDGRSEVELAWAVVPDRWGEGLATEMGALALDVAFGRLALPDVVAVTLPANTASRRVMEKLGLTYERDVVHATLPHVLYRRVSNETGGTVP
jgi:RimJ/RimL family protein N-acetyltransferase